MKTPHIQAQCNIKPQQFRFITESSKLNMKTILLILCSVDRTSLYNLVNETKLV